MKNKELSPIELLERIHSDLNKLKASAFLFGMGAELDIKKANVRINFALDAAKQDIELMNTLNKGA